MRRALGCLMVLAAIGASSDAYAGGLDNRDRGARATTRDEPEKRYRDTNPDILQSFLPSSDPAVTLELTEEREGRVFRTVFTDRAGTDMRTGVRQTLATVQIFSPEGGIVFAQSTILSDEFNDAETEPEGASVEPDGIRFRVEANSTADIIRHLGTLIRARKWLQAAKYLVPIVAARKITDAGLAPIVKSLLEAQGQYCPPKPRWWIAPTWAWYLLGCRGMAYSF